MYQSDIGPLDGDTWEGLIQAVFKKNMTAIRKWWHLLETLA
ncbi:hypothetical protein DA89_1680 [Vibrio cholerae]|nr:hypothetical protein DA89_1680 [Vibrio cholerae]